MPASQDINYERIVEQSLEDFAPVKRLWPAGLRLLLWALVQAAVVAIILASDHYHDLSTLLGAGAELYAIFPFMAVSCWAAWLALRSAVPGREIRWSELALLVLGVCTAFVFPRAMVATIDHASAGGPSMLPFLFLLPVFPWLTLCFAVRRGVSLQPTISGLLLGIASGCFASGLYLFLAAVDGYPASLGQLAILIGLISLLSTLAGELWLDWIATWRADSDVDQASPERWDSKYGNTTAVAAFGLALLAVTVFPKVASTPVPDFDLAVDAYQSSLRGFHPNVPSNSIDAMLTAYVNHGMPAYMWDFSSQGYKLVGGRWAPLPDGTPLTYTWFRGRNGGIICLFRLTEHFDPPKVPHKEYHHLFFYRYQGFSICLLNVGGYGSFIGVVAAKMPMDKFIPLVIAAIG